MAYWEDITVRIFPDYYEVIYSYNKCSFIVSIDALAEEVKEIAKRARKKIEQEITQED